jgi:predicted metal-dependent hydrolase
MNPLRRAAFLVRVDDWVSRTKLIPTRVRLRHMKKLWAVCNPDDSITFACALLDQPSAFQDLVICHELVHLCIRDHGEYFQLMLELLQPDWRDAAYLVPPTPAELKPTYRVEDCAFPDTVSNWVSGTRYASLAGRSLASTIGDAH